MQTTHLIERQAVAIFPDVFADSLCSLVKARRRSTRVLHSVWSNDESPENQATFQMQVIQATQTELDTKAHLTREASKWTELNRIRRVVYSQLHIFLSAFERNSPLFSDALAEIPGDRFHIKEALHLFIECGACPRSLVCDLKETLDRCLSLLAWTGGFYLESFFPQKRKSNYQLIQRISWDSRGPPSECLDRYRDLGTQGLDTVLRSVSREIANRLLSDAHTPLEEGSIKDLTCAICLDSIEDDGMGITRLRCGHSYHTECLRGQFSHAFKNHEPLRCGLCRRGITM